MVREQTIEKYTKIKKMLKAGSTIRQIKTTLKCSEGTINDAKNYVPIVPKKIRTPKERLIENDEYLRNVAKQSFRNIRTIKDKKGTSFDLNMAVTLKSIIKKVSKQYWNKSKEDIADIEKFEEYMTKRTGIEFNFVLSRKLVEELAKFDDEIKELNGGH